jgi:hypothetical protein
MITLLGIFASLHAKRRANICTCPLNALENARRIDRFRSVGEFHALREPNSLPLPLRSHPFRPPDRRP